MKALLIGGAGFLGATITQSFAEAGHDVAVFDRRTPRALVPDLSASSSDCEAITGDVASYDDVLDAVQRTAPDVIVHVAAILALGSAADPYASVAVNALGTANVFRAAVETAVPKVVYASSVGAFTGHPLGTVVAHATPFKPGTFYGATKEFNEYTAAAFKAAHGLDTVGIRLAFIAGPHGTEGAARPVVRVMVMRPALGLEGIVHWADDSAGWLWVGDAARAFLSAAESAEHSLPVYGVSGEVATMRQAAGIVADLIPGATFQFEPGAMGLATNVDAAEAERDLGWRPEWDLRSQFEAIIAAVRADPATIAPELVDS